MYREAVRFFGTSEADGSKYVSHRKYYTDKFACVIDFRTVDDDNVSGSGRKLVGTQAGILMEIEKIEITTTDLSCHVFVFADGIITLWEITLMEAHNTKNSNENAYDNRRNDCVLKNTLPFEFKNA